MNVDSDFHRNDDKGEKDLMTYIKGGNFFVDRMLIKCKIENGVISNLCINHSIHAY